MNHPNLAPHEPDYPNPENQHSPVEFLREHQGKIAGALLVTGLASLASWSVHETVQNNERDQQITEARQEQIQTAIDEPIKAVTETILEQKPEESADGYTYFTHVDPKDQTVSLHMFTGAEKDSERVTVSYKVAADSEILTGPQEVTLDKMSDVIADKDTHVMYAEYLAGRDQGHESGRVSTSTIKTEHANNGDLDLTDRGEWGTFDNLHWLTNPRLNTDEQFADKLENAGGTIGYVAEGMKQTASHILASQTS